ncbi:MAG: alpha/beta hydrolase [Saprospiraceae bacterium]
MKSLVFDGIKLCYTLEGKGTPVVLLHGFCEDSRMWDDFKQDLLEEQHRVLAIDLPGFGRSQLAETPSVDYYAQAVFAVMDARKMEEAVVIGHSMGGYVALAMAAQQPQRLKGLGLFHSHPFVDKPEKKAARLKQVEFINKHGHQLFVKQLIPKLFAPAYAQSHPFDVDKFIHRAARYPAAGIVGGLYAMANRPDRSHILSELEAPVLFIVGAEDEAVPYEASIDQLALPAIASVHWLPKVGHMGMVELMRPTQRIVRRFVDFCVNPGKMATVS